MPVKNLKRSMFMFSELNVITETSPVACSVTVKMMPNYLFAFLAALPPWPDHGSVMEHTKHSKTFSTPVRMNSLKRLL